MSCDFAMVTDLAAGVHACGEHVEAVRMVGLLHAHRCIARAHRPRVYTPTRVVYHHSGFVSGVCGVFVELRSCHNSLL